MEVKSSNNRFFDSEDEPIDSKQLMASCEKWSLKNDLELLSHLKQLSNDLITKTENTNQSINSLVFEAKMHCVKVDNVINEFQMLANSQFVENRVYDEEMDDIITNGSNVAQNEEMVSNKSKDEEILPKIKCALNIGLDFLNERFDCVSKQIPQNDSDDENDQIVEGLISHNSRDEYSQRLLPFIIGSEDFIKDNYVGLSCTEESESPVIDLKTKAENNINISVESVGNNFESESNIFDVRNGIPNNFIDNMNDSEEESNDIFVGISQSVTNNKRLDSSDESDFEEQSTHEKIETNKTIESKPIVRSFYDELSAAISAKNQNNPLFISEDQKTKTEFVAKNRIQTPIILDSESSDESDSIFKVTTNKTKTETKQKSNFSNLFGEESNENTLFEEKVEKPKPIVVNNKVLPNSNSKTVINKISSLFDDEDEDDDLFVSTISKKITKPSVEIEKEKTNIFAQNISTTVQKESLFDDEEEDDDLFAITSTKSPKTTAQNSNVSEPVVKSKTSSEVNKTKPINSFIGELSSALKKKNLYQSDDGNSSSSEENFETTVKSNNVLSDDSNNKKDTNVTKLPVIENESNDSIGFGDNYKKDISKVVSNEVLGHKESDLSTDTNANEDFISKSKTITLSNDGLKHRAILGSKRNRRPPSKKTLKMTPILDLSQNSEPKEDISEEKSSPIPAIRTVKTNESMTNSIETIENTLRSDLSTDQLNSKSMATLVKSPSTEEEDIFPTQTNGSKNTNISKLFSKSETPSLSLFDDFDDNEDSLFSSNKTKRTEVTQKVVDKTGLFDTSDSEDDKFGSNISNKSETNVISNLIKPSNSDLFNDVSSTDSSLSNKSELKIENSKPNVNLFSDSDDDDLFSAVVKTKLNDNSVKKEPIVENIKRNENIEKSKKINSLFSDSEDDKSDLFGKNEEIKGTKPMIKSNVKPIFDSDDDDNDDIFAPKVSKAKTSKPSVSSKTKPKTKSESSDLFDDPLFVSRS